MPRRMLVSLVAAIASVAFVPAASASINPMTVKLSPGATTAGATQPLTMDLTFTPTGGDTVKDLTLQLPAGLLANASIDGGACLRSSMPTAACQVGAGTVTATANELVPLQLTLNATFDLVAPPTPGDLAGLALVVTNPVTGPAELGSPGAITVRPSTDPAGVGLNIAFTNIPKTYLVALGLSAPISVDQIHSVFAGLRMPASCPSPPARFTATAGSYGDSTQQSASAPLTVTGCSGLAFAPVFGVTAVGDPTDSGVKLVTNLTQTRGQATSRIVALAFPSSVLTPNVAAVLTGGILCTDPTFATCKTIGSANATSPLYPRTLTGTDYLTGTLSAPAITIVFPPPFSLTLDGAVNLATNTTAFTNVPDIPLTDLTVTLAGGPNAVFAATCAPASGTAAASLTSQNGDQTALRFAAFTVSPCTPLSAGTGGGGGSSGGATGGGSGNGAGAKVGRPRIAAASLTGLKHRRPKLSFRLIAGQNAPGLTSLTIRLPGGLSFVRRHHRRLQIAGLAVAGAKLSALVLRRGRLTVTLRRPVTGLRVVIGPRGLAASAALQRKVTHHRTRRVKLTLSVRNAMHKSATLTRWINRLNR